VRVVAPQAEDQSESDGREDRDETTTDQRPGIIVVSFEPNDDGRDPRDEPGGPHGQPDEVKRLVAALSRSARCRLIRSTSYFVGSIFG
jgi:hypothetical protein